VLQKIESQMKKCESHLEGVKKRQTELIALDPEIISPYEMETLQSSFMDLQRKVFNSYLPLKHLCYFRVESAMMLFGIHALYMYLFLRC